MAYKREMRSENQKARLIQSPSLVSKPSLQVLALLFLSCLLSLGLYLAKTTTLKVQFTQLQPFSGSNPPSPPPLEAFAPSSRESTKMVEPNNPIGARGRMYPMHGMGDAELMWRASRTPRNVQLAAGIVPKVAFMFLTKGDVPLAPLWDMFFRGHQGLFSIYVHSDPSFNGSDPTSQSSVFHARTVPSKVVEWGKTSMIEAERRLLANALLDSANQRFILLSDSCIPLFNFSIVYSYLMNSNHTFVESYDLPGLVGRGRFHDQMRPQIEIEQWRKGSQWFQIDRNLAVDVVMDRTYFPVFQKYCGGRCYSDEHYLPTYVHIKCPERNDNQTLTWVDWSKGGPHPASFRREHVTFEFLELMRNRTTCQYNGKTTNVCHLFARKFGAHALDRLLRFAPKIMHFDS